MLFADPITRTDLELESRGAHAATVFGDRMAMALLEQMGITVKLASLREEVSGAEAVHREST